VIATALVLLLGGFLGLHLLTAGIAAARYLLPDRQRRNPDRPFITLLRPMHGVDAFDRETLASSFGQDYPDYEILFCIADGDDPGVALAAELIAAHPGARARLLIGDTRVSANPKLNNVIKGWRESRAAFVAMADANLLLAPGYLAELAGRWGPGTGAVSAPAVGTRPGNFWGAVECAFLNTNQARWQLAADAVGLGFAQGKTLFLNRGVIEAGGGLAALGREMAEDLATTKLVRAQGLKVRLTRRLFDQPVGEKTASQVWDRQLRWSRIRRDGVPVLFGLEILQGFAAPLLALLGLVALGAVPGWSIFALAIAWYGTEAVLARIAGWPMGWRELAALPVRDALLPVLWLATFRSRAIAWRGTTIKAAETGAGG
jgi:ceramide glucosyltransferase